MKKKNPGDQEERDRAVDSKANVSVTAGAGTGKTTLLVSKVLHKVLDEGLDIRRLLALTFTEKAASEMRIRIEEHLRNSRHARAKEALAGLDRAEIGTIHSFCAHILRQFPLEAGVDPNFIVDEGRFESRLFDREWPRWLDEELRVDGLHRDEWLAVLERLSIDDLAQVARELARFDVPDEAMAGSNASETLKRFLTQAEPGKGRDKLAEEAGLAQDSFFARVLRLLAVFVGRFRAAYRREAYVSFAGMLALSRALLLDTKFPEAREILKEKYRFILVDEFQDTDPMQGEIVLYLAERSDRCSFRPEDVRLEPGKLFIVGDPKQSIYSFRGADIVSYDQVRSRVENQEGERVVLRTNFRSHRGILDLVNAAFREIIRERIPLQPVYEPVEPEMGREPELPAQRIELHLIGDSEGKISADDARTGEGEVIGDWIATNVGKTKLPGGKMRWKDIAILLRALTSVNTYLEALRARGIPFVVEGEKFYYQTIEVIDFINLLRTVVNPYDTIALVGVLRSPLGALTDEAIYELKKANALDYRKPGPEPLFGLLRSWHERAGLMTVPELFDAIFEESPILELASRGIHGEQAVANLLKLRQKAFELEAEGGITPAEFLRVAREAVKELEEEGESPLADETLDAVRVLSVHKAKGLEFPVVILPDLHRQGGGRAQACPVRYDWPTRTLGLRIGKLFDSGGAALEYLDCERQREEEARLFYVAMTRARETLVLTGSADRKADSWLGRLLSAVPPSAKLYEVHEHVRGGIRTPPPRETVASTAQDWGPFLSRWKERSRFMEEARVDRFTSPSRLEEKRRPMLEAEEWPRDSRAADLGILCHKILEELDFSRPAIPPGTDAEAVDILTGFFESPAFHELATSEILARELPFVMPHGTRILHGIIDVVYRRNGKVVVADYKTDRLVNPEEYRLARDLYVRAVESILDVSVSGFRLFYLRHGRGVDL